MSISAESNRSVQTLSSVNDASDDVLLIELLRRGYDVARLLEKNNTQQPFQLPTEDPSLTVSK